MTTDHFALPLDAELIGVARCSEAEPQCLAVAKCPDGSLLLANHVGAQLKVPADEVPSFIQIIGGLA